MTVIVDFGDSELKVTPMPNWMDWAHVPSTKIETLKNDVKEKVEMKKEDVLKVSLTTYERDILELADEMASAMSDLNAHNYKNFVDARDAFRGKLKEMCEHSMVSHEKVERMKKMVAEI